MPADPISVSALTRFSLSLSLLMAGVALLAPFDDAGATAPLGLLETARADELARGFPPPDKRTRSAATMHPLGLQSVVIEPEFRKGQTTGERRARVYQYDHVSQRARLVRVDLVSDAVLESRPIDGHHLPLSVYERRWALERLTSERVLIVRLRAEQTRRGEPAFASLDELDVKASVFEPLDASHPCARERCALLSLFDASRTVFATEPLVRFSTGDVTTLDVMVIDADAH